MTASIAIIGTGPSGYYAAEALLRKLPGCRIDMIDRLPTPFGLVRAGVAPDHQSTKTVQRLFERSAARDGVRFLGHVEIGRDVGYDELKSIYDAVVVATGAPVDRKLKIPGENLPGVHGSWSFVGWYNGHPAQRDLDPGLAGPAVAVIGNGNVAIDCVRVLAKSSAEMAQSDLSRHAADTIAAAPLTDLYLIGRRGPLEASFTPLELSELGTLARCVPLVDGAALERDIAAGDPETTKKKEKNIAILRNFARNEPGSRPIALHFVFWKTPVAFLGTERLEAVRLLDTSTVPGGTGEITTLPVATAITAIGYGGAPFPGLPFDGERGIARHEGGRIETGVYGVGWIKRGPSGTIPTNRADGLGVAELIAADFAGPIAAPKSGPAALDALLAARKIKPVSFDDWRRIDAAEIARAAAGRPREKFTRIEEMLAACRGGEGER